MAGRASTRRAALALVVSVMLLILGAGCGQRPGAHQAEEPAPSVPASSATTIQAPTPEASFLDEGSLAQEALTRLAIKGRAPKTGYARAEFGQKWKDIDRNGCDTRNDVLARDLTDTTFRDGTGNCVVLSGALIDPYTGRMISFQRGQATSNAVQIDHVVALSDAWQKGAQRLTIEERERLANDPLNLLAVDGPTNQAKGDGDAATWLPPSKQYRCEYVARQIAVKDRYGLWVTQAEFDAMSRVLGQCPGQSLPLG